MEETTKELKSRISVMTSEQRRIILRKAQEIAKRNRRFDWLLGDDGSADYFLDCVESLLNEEPRSPFVPLFSGDKPEKLMKTLMQGMSIIA